MKVGYFITAILAIIPVLHTSALAAAPPDCKTRPAWCLNGYVCQPTACTAAMTAELRLLTAEAAASPARSPRWGFCAGVGLGLTAAPYDRDPTDKLDLAVSWSVGPVAAVTWGWRFGVRSRVPRASE